MTFYNRDSTQEIAPSLSLKTIVASHPAETAFHHPAARQQHKATFGGRQLHYFEPHALRRGVLGGLLAGVALVDKCHLNRLAGRFLDVLGQFGDLRTFLQRWRRWAGAHDRRFHATACADPEPDLQRHQRSTIAGFADRWYTTAADHWGSSAIVRRYGPASVSR